MSTPNGFDLDTSPDIPAVEDLGVEVPLLDIRGEPWFFTNEEGEQERMSITVAGSYSHRWRRAEEDVTTRMTESGRVTKLTADMFRAQQTETLAACVLRWRGFFKGGVPMEPVYDNVLKAFARYPHIRDQADAGAKNHAGFFKDS